MQATGGSDCPEDLCGGLEEASKLEWRAPSRHMFIIADAPCHGKQYHDERDSYPEGDPNQGRVPEKQIIEMIKAAGAASLNITFLKLNSGTDKMVSVLNAKCKEALGTGDTIKVVDLSAASGGDIAEGFEGSILASVGDALSETL